MTRIVVTTLLVAFATVAQAIRLTNLDWNVVAGETFIIKWTDAQGGVSLRLKSGPANSLQTVQEIASGQSGESFTWAVPTNLDITHYAIEIEDSSGNINYSVQFSVSGASASQPPDSSEEPATTTAAAITTSGTLAEAAVSPTIRSEVTTVSSDAPETMSETERPSRSADFTETQTATASSLTTTRANKPSTTESDANVTKSEVPNSGTTGESGSALVGAVFGAILLAY